MNIKDLLNENLRLEYLDIIKKTVALLCNGASVIIIIMVGCRAGVGAMLREDQSCLITLHCTVTMFSAVALSTFLTPRKFTET
jgi:hypothetical protein